MADTTKLASSFAARRVTLRTPPHYLGDAISRCLKGGLFPSVFGYLDGHILFRVLIPRESLDALERVMSDCAGVIEVTDTTLIAPLPKA